MGLFDRNTAGSLRRGRIRYFPVAPGRMEFAEAVRAELLAERPSVVAVELPATLEESFRRAVERLPQLSVIVYDDDESERAVYLPVEVTDPFVEALRTGRELGCDLAFLDPDLSERPHVEDVYPDSYAVRRLGLERYIESYRLEPRPRDRQIALHAEGLAWKLQGCDPEADILVVVSLNLLDPLLDAMEKPQTQPLRKVTRRGVRTLNLHADSLAEVCVEPPFLQAVYEARRSGRTHDGVEIESLRPPARPEARQVRGFEVVDAPKQDSRETALQTALREPRDRQGVLFQIVIGAELAYERESGESIAHWQRRALARFSRNLALVDNQLLPSLFDLATAARSVIDDNYAWNLWQTAGYYPYQKTAADLQTVRVDGEQMWLNTRKIRLRRKFRSKKGRGKPLGLRGRKREPAPGEWKKQWRGTGLCSYPPEDLKIEEYGFYLKNKGKSVLSEERARTQPFTSSMLDGIDLRQTLRNWHDKRQIYVRELQKVQGDVGAVVLIFDEDRDNRYPYCMTWLGEHQNESDMAFYSTNPHDHAVGPGIGRAEYGGLLLSLPSQRMADVWSDPDYAFAESKPETLLLAALDYSLERIIVYAAPKPPRSIFRTIAGRMGRKIVYIPLSGLSPAALKKLRVMHVLDGHDRRREAKDYIW